MVSKSYIGRKKATEDTTFTNQGTIPTALVKGLNSKIES